MNIRDNKSLIHSGDLLVWEHGNGTILDTLGLGLVKYLTKSRYAHVGIAFKLLDTLYVIEAVPSAGVRIAQVGDKDSFYFIAMNIDWQVSHQSILFHKLGDSYSFIDDIKAYFGEHINEKDRKWQCVELAHYFYKSIGLDLGNVFTPVKMVEKLLRSGYLIHPSSTK